MTMSNIESREFRTLEEIRADAARLREVDQPEGLFSRPSADEMKEIEARLAAATGGPWTIYAGNTGIRGSLPYAWVGPEVEQWDGSKKIAPVVERANGGTMADMRFIAHARIDMAKLINLASSLSARLVAKSREVAQARQDAAAAREKSEHAIRRAARHTRSYEQNALAAHNRADRAERRLEEYGRDAMERTRVIDKIRQRFGIEPGEDLYEGLSRKVGELQTSEAELVSAPLKARIEEQESRIKTQEVNLKDAYAEIERLKQSVGARDRLLDSATREREEARQDVKSRETEIRLLETALDDWRRSVQKVAELVYDRATVDALEYESYPPDQEKSWTKLAEVIKEIRKVTSRLPLGQLAEVAKGAQKATDQEGGSCA